MLGPEGNQTVVVESWVVATVGKSDQVDEG